ncbi:BCS1 N terminal-domain-containing protein [Geopyxis carbonaria]|nr:BCS1 N terminal-domain-containing protein [Geopyxis carbonaria]
MEPISTTAGFASRILGKFGVGLDAMELTSLFVAITVIWGIFRGALDYIFRQLSKSVWSHIEIRNDQVEPYDQFLAWLQNQPFNHDCRNLRVKQVIECVGHGGRSWTYRSRKWTIMGDGSVTSYGYSPADGWHYFRYRGQWVALFRNSEEQRDIYGGSNESIRLYVLGRDPTILKELMEECRHEYVQHDSEKTIVYRDGGTASGKDGWKRCFARFSRPLDTVVLDEKQKNEFVEDIEEYLSPSTARWYGYRGIPYRRGYLLYGPPGTGKSSLSFAAAGIFGLRIYVLSLASTMLTEDRLSTLFSTLPTKCIVLLEDVDSAFVDRGTHSPEVVTGPAKPGQPLRPDPSKPADRVGISFSGLLNAIDGVSSQEGRILIMTTNHIEKLDPALIRPGRVDLKIEFKLASTTVLAALFERMFDVDPEEEPTDATTPNADVDEEKRVAKLKHMAQTFAEKVPTDVFSPAEIQGFLLTQKRRPERALMNVDAWVVETLRRMDEEKKKKMIILE